MNSAESELIGFKRRHECLQTHGDRKNVSKDFSTMFQPFIDFGFYSISSSTNSWDVTVCTKDVTDRTVRAEGADTLSL